MTSAEARALRATANARLLALAAPASATDVADHLAHQLQPMLAILDAWTEERVMAAWAADGPLAQKDADLEILRACADRLVALTHALKPVLGRGPATDGQGRRVETGRVTSDPRSTHRVKKNF